MTVTVASVQVLTVVNLSVTSNFVMNLVAVLKSFFSSATIFIRFELTIIVALFGRKFGLSGSNQTEGSFLEYVHQTLYFCTTVFCPFFVSTPSFRALLCPSLAHLALTNTRPAFSVGRITFSAVKRKCDFAPPYSSVPSEKFRRLIHEESNWKPPSGPTVRNTNRGKTWTEANTGRKLDRYWEGMVEERK